MMKLAICSSIVTMLLCLSCGDNGNASGNVCREAEEKLNECSDAAAARGVSPVAPKMDLGPGLLLCKDEFELYCSPAAGGPDIVALESWSETYVDCEIDPDTCLCPGQPFICPDIYP